MTPFQQLFEEAYERDHGVLHVTAHFCHIFAVNGKVDVPAMATLAEKHLTSRWWDVFDRRLADVARINRMIVPPRLRDPPGVYCSTCDTYKLPAGYGGMMGIMIAKPKE